MTSDNKLDTKETLQKEIKTIVLDMLQLPNTVVTSVEFNDLNIQNDDVEVVVKMILE